MSDRFIGALPRELTPDQCIEAVEKFCRNVTQDRVPWHFALHLELDKKNEPDWNPHVHILFRDRDIETGRRYLYTSAGPKERAQLDAKGIDYWSTKDFREKWSADMNHALERAGHDVRIDHRSLKEQGIDRDPQIHIGPGSQNAAKKGHEFESQDRQIAGRAIPYSLLDSGSRADHNARIVEGNKQPVASREHPEQLTLREAQAQIRRAMYREQKRDRDTLRQTQQVQLDQHKQWAKKLYADARKAAFEQVKEQTSDRWKAVHAITDKPQREAAAEALKGEQQKLYAKVSTLHIGQARVEKDQAWQALKKEQGQEQLDLRTTHREEYAALTRQHTAERLGIAEKHRAHDLQRDANRVAARLGGHFGMAAQQRATVNIIRLKQNAGLAPGAEITPAEAIKAFMQTARDEHGKREKIREGLNARRQTDRLRGTTPDRFRAQAGSAMDGIDQQTQARQAAASGRTLSARNAPMLRKKSGNASTGRIKRDRRRNSLRKARRNNSAARIAAEVDGAGNRRAAKAPAARLTFHRANYAPKGHYFSAFCQTPKASGPAFARHSARTGFPFCRRRCAHIEARLWRVFRVFFSAGCRVKQSAANITSSR